MPHLVRWNHRAFKSIPTIIALTCMIFLFCPAHARGATIAVPASGSLQAALDAAQPGDVVTLTPGATYIGNFVLPNKGEIRDDIVVRSAAPDSALPPAGIRLSPAYGAWLPKIKSPNSQAALKTAPSANHWKLMFLEFQANQNGAGEIIALGAGDSTQNDVSQVPHHLVLDRLYVHGDPVLGQKRGIALNSRDTSIINSYISECKVAGQDSQAIQGHNGPGNYLIENNYLEGAAENFMLGGADPAIPNLVTGNVLFRRNYLRKPIEWRDAISTAPSDVAASVSSSGSLTGGTYAYRVVSRAIVGQGNKAVSAASAEVQATIAAGLTGAVVLTWSAVSGATDYLVYGRTPAAENIYWTTTTPTFTDTGAAGTAGTPAKATRWLVKNLFELKNARDVVVEGNVMENLWVADQSGYAIQLTPRNQSGHAPWSTVEQVTIRGNLLRHVAGGVNVLGYDNLNPSQQANHLTLHDNLFDDLTAETWGTGSRPVQLGAGPDAITIDHNTFITTDSTIMYLYGGPATSPTPITNTTFTNNLSRHNTYGINGSSFSPGMPAILAYMPDSVITANVLAGGTASKYPAGNFFPTTLDWPTHFVDYAGGNYRLTSSSPFRAAGTDGADLGADIDMVTAHANRALIGDVTDSPSPGPPGSTVAPPPLTITTSSVVDGIVGQQYAALLAASGGTGSQRWIVASGALPGGIALAEGGAISGVPTAAGTFAFTVQVADSQEPPATARQPLSLVIAPIPVSIVTSTLPSGNVASPYSASLAASGSAGAIAWSLDGVLPDGLTLDASGSINGSPTTLGTSTFTVRATDSAAPANTVTQSFTVVIGAREIVLHTSAARIVGTAWSRVLDAAAADGSRVWNPNRGAAKLGTASAAPASYVELTFQAEAGVPYHLWLRAKAERNSTSNDSVHLQFSSSVNGSGSAVYRIGTTQSTVVVLEDGYGAGVSGWGWQDDRYGGLSQPIYFQTPGVQTIRLQQREDGISIDQVVLSAGKYLSSAPGAFKNDTVIVTP